MTSSATTNHDVEAPRFRPASAPIPTGPGLADGMAAARRPTGPVVALLIVLAAFSVGRVAVALPLSLLIFGPDGPDTATLGGQLFNNLVPFAATLLSLYVWVRFKERRPFATLGFASRPSRAVVGALVAPLMIAPIVGVGVATGQLSVEARPVGAALVGGVLLALVGFVVQASTEDVLFRGFLLQAGVRRWGLAVAVGFQAAVFALIHSVNPGGLAVLPLVNLLLFALFLAAWALLEGGLWVACAWHAMWNWTQGNVLGVQVSGEGVDTSLLRTTTTPGSHDLLTGGSFGLEGGLLCTAVLLVGLVCVTVVHRRRRTLVPALRPTAAPHRAQH